ncbi:hypothetical protein B0O80DRAFT_384940 [Mortierella sp. GBAus27b]|nr:hypothetical protein B0O80DRAFT_384940 [Mortierella sp. GBAus27b]
MLLFLKSKQSNYLQTPMGMYLYAQGCSKSVISVLSHVGLSVSYSSIQNALETLTEDALNTVRAAISEHSWFLLYDNINFLNRKYDQRSDNKNTFENGTTATIVITKGVEKMRQVHDQRPAPYLGDILPDERSNLHFQTVFKFYLVKVLQRHYPTYERYSVSIPSMQPLKPEKTEAYPLPAMKIDQSTVEGNVDIIETLMKSVLKLDPKEFSDDMIIVAGDQLTVSRVGSAKRLRREDVTPFHRLQWAVPVIQLFHLQMLLCFTILRTHRGKTSTPGSLALYVEMLDRKYLGQDTTNYHAADEMLKHTFDAMIWRVWKVELGTDHLEKYGSDQDDATLRDDIASLKIFSKTLFIRDMIVYLELCAAIKCGDTGRIVKVLQMINIITTRLRPSPQHTKAILSSWLVNTKGKENSWLPSDLYQEHNNLLTKTVHAAKGINMSWESLARSISTNIHMFSRVTAQMESQYSAPFNSITHTTVKAETDIRLIQQSLKEHNILGHPFPINPNVLLVKDLFVEGYTKLAEGRFNKFVECMDNVLGSDENDDTLVHESEADIY